MSFLLAALLGLGEMPREAGVHKLVFERDGRLPMRFVLSLPEGDAASRPLVLALHYAGHGAPFYGEDMVATLVEPALRELRPIVIAPDCPTSSWATSRSEETVLALLDFISEVYDVDRERIVVTGYSMGGIGAWYLASRHPDRFSAAIPMAGSPRSVNLENVAATPLYAIHSRVDEVVALAPTEKAVSELESRGARVELVVVEDIPHYHTPRFRPYLEQTVDWLRAVWKE